MNQYNLKDIGNEITVGYSDVQKFIKNVELFWYLTLRERSWKYSIIFFIFTIFSFIRMFRVTIVRKVSQS